MKPQNFLLLLGVVAIAGLALFAYSAASAPLPEGFPPPTPEGQIELKSYPAYRAATYRYSGDLAQAANRAFGPLFQHISDNDISMTAPVETRYPSSTITLPQQQGEASVSFLYRNPRINPQNRDRHIAIEDIPPMQVVSMGLRGEYNYQSYLDSLARLRQWLEQHPEYSMAGPPRRFFYDGPYIPDSFKRSEIQIPLARP